MKFKKTISIILALALVLQCFTFITFGGQQKTKVYTAIGDSTSVGYHPELGAAAFNDLSLYMNNPNKFCYPKLLADRMGYKVNDIGICGLNSDNLKKIMTDPEVQFALQTETISGGLANANLNELIFCKYPNEKNRYYDAIKEADLLTLNIGSNDLLKTPLASRFMKIAIKLMKSTGTKELDEETLNSIVSFMKDAFDKDLFAPIVEEYKANYDVIFHEVFKMKKPGAKLVLVGCYNPFSKENLSDRVHNAIDTGEIWAHMGGNINDFKNIISSVIAKLPENQKEGLQTYLDTEVKAVETEMAEAEENGEGEAVKPASTLTSLMSYRGLTSDLIYVLAVAILGDRVQEFIDDINEVAKGYAKKYALFGVEYVDVPGCTVPLNAVDMHPDNDGHNYIADRIFDTVTKSKLIKTYEVEAKVKGFGGVISDCGKTNYLPGYSVDYTITPLNNFKINKVYVNGKQVEVAIDENGVGTYHFESIKGNKTITATFKYAGNGNVAKFLKFHKEESESGGSDEE